GRQAAWFVQGDFGSAVLRHYRRGGLIAKLSANRYIWTGATATRSFAEFQLLCFMYKVGLPVPRPLAAAYWRQGCTYRAAILVQRIAMVVLLVEAWPAAEAAAGAVAIIDMQQVGGRHADLNAYNIVLDEQGKARLIGVDQGCWQVLQDKLRQD